MKRTPALSAATKVAMAITASTLTSVIVFLPLVVGGKDDVTIFLGDAARILAWTAAIVVAGMVVGFLPFILMLIETSTFSGSVNRRIGINYEVADFTYKSDAEKTVSQVEDFLWSRKEEFLVRDLLLLLRREQRLHHHRAGPGGPARPCPQR